MFGFGLALAQRVDAHLANALHRVRHVLVQVRHDAAHHDVVVVHGRLPDFVAALRQLALVAGRHEEELAALVAVRAGQTDIGGRALPEVVDQPDDGAGRNLDDHRPGLAEIDVGERVDRGVVGREPHRLRVDELVGNAHVVVVGAEVLLRRQPDRFERHRRIGPQVGLHGTLVVQLVEQLARRLFGRIAALELQGRRCASSPLSGVVTDDGTCAAYFGAAAPRLREVRRSRRVASISASLHIASSLVISPRIAVHHLPPEPSGIASVTHAFQPSGRFFASNSW